MTTPLVVHFGASIRLLDKRNAIRSLKRDFQVDRKLNGSLDFFSGQEKQNKNSLLVLFNYSKKLEFSHCEKYSLHQEAYIQVMIISSTELTT